MIVYGEADQRFCRSLTIYSMSQYRVKAGLYRIPRTNRHVALVDYHGMPVHGARQLVIVEEFDKPLWQQHMDLQMGRMPQKRVSRRTEILEEISEEEAEGYMFSIYRVRY